MRDHDTYLPSLWNGFVWDDFHLIVNNQALRGDAAFTAAFTSDYWGGGTGTNVVSDYYRPLTTLTLLLDWKIWGTNPFGYHLTNVLLHAAASLALLAAARRFGATAVQAFIGAALFAVHPVHLESVAWIAGRTDVLCTALVLGALATRGPLSWALGAGALLSKEVAVVWPILASLRDRKVDWRARLPEIVLVVAFLFTRHAVLTVPLAPSPVGFDAAATSVGTLHLVGLLLAPWLALPIYVAPFELSSLWLGAAVGVPVVAGLAVLAWREPRARPWLIAAAILLIPSLAVLARKQVLGARFLYAPSAFLCLAVAVPLARLATRRIVRVAIAPLVVGVAATLAVVGARHWRGNLEFWTWVGAKAATHPEVHVQVAVNQHDAGALADAWSSLDRASAAKLPELHYMRALIFSEVGCADTAADEYRRAIVMNPRYVEAWGNLGALLRTQGRPNEAIDILTRAQASGVDSPQIRRVLDKARGTTGMDRPLPSCDRPIPAIVSDPERLNSEALARGREGEVEQAEILVRAALRLRPDYAQALFTLAQVRYLGGNHRGAVNAALEALARDAHLTLAWKVLGLSYLKLGDTERGRDYLRRYLDAYPGAPDAGDLRRILGG